MNKFKIMLLFSIFCLLILIPTGFAVDNDTIMGSGGSTNDYYFDANIENEGDGSIYNPYKSLTSDRIKQNSNLHLANGEYKLNRISSPNNVNIIGTDPEKTIISFNGVGFDLDGSLTLTNVTLINLGIKSSGNSLIATNTIFTGFSSNSANVINSNSNVALNNCSFYDNSANIGGAIYINGGKLTINDSRFKNNVATLWGGALACDDDSEIEIYNSKFENCYSKEDVGGAIYLKKSKFKSENLEINNCYATIGGAIASLDSDINLNNFKSRNNRAKFNGGAVYALNNYFSITYSTLINNTADNGGAIFADAVEIFSINNNNFINNTATVGEAVYSLISDFYYDSLYDDALKNKFVNNDAYVASKLNLIFNNNNYIIFKLNSSYDGVLPSYYSLKDLGQVSPVKDQGKGGNCWAFSSLAALESAVLKSTGIQYDLSEENMKNLMSLYSSYGWVMETNTGGYDKMGVGYLTGWLGPVNESDDPYNPKSLISPLLTSFIHVQNIVFLTRNNHTDNDAIKKALMDYGAVATSTYWSSAFLKGQNYYYNGNNAANHAVVIVGWDDNYSASNFKTAPPGDGAWIIKNSWGDANAGKGFYYVSYYDTKFSQPGKYVSYAIILNDTIKYDKIYQYDVQGKSDYLYNHTNTVWYKNKFEANADEYLAAASTYFEKDTKWDLSVYVNDILKLTKSGKSFSGYSTIELGEFIPITAGDVFEIVFKITVDGNVGVPISERVSLNQETYSENNSFISYDGKTWADLYELECSFPDHSYYSQVACIKAFTILNPINTDIKLDITNMAKNTCDVIATVLDEYGNVVTHGNVVFNIAGIEKTVNIHNGIAKYSGAIIKDGINNFTAKFNEIGYTSSNTYVLVSDTLTNTVIDLDYSSPSENPIMFTACVKTQDGVPLDYGEVTFNIEGINYTVKVSNGIASLIHTFKSFGIKTISAVYSGLYCYNPSEIKKSITFSLQDVSISIDADSQYNPVSISAEVIDEYGNKVNTGNVTFQIEGKNYQVPVVDGVATLTHVFTTAGYNRVVAVYNDNTYNYNSNSTQKYVYVELKKTTLDVNLNDSATNPVNIVCTVKDIDGKLVDSGKVSFNLNGLNKRVEVVDGIASLEYVFNNVGMNSISLNYKDDNYRYEESSKNIQLNVSKTPVDLYLNTELIDDTLKITIDVSQKIDDYAVVNINKQYNLVKLANGQAIFNIWDITPGKYSIESYVRSNCYESNTVLKEITVNPRSTKIGCDVSAFNYDNVLYCPVTLIDEFGNGVVNARVSMNIGGKTFSALTNGSGVALIKFNADPGDFNINICFDGNTMYTKSSLDKKISVKSSITLPTATKYTYNAPYKVTLYDSQGNLLKDTEVTFTANNVKYAQSTDSNGVLNFKIPLSVASYTISLTNPDTGEVKSQNINVIARITGNKAITMYYGAGTCYKVRVYDDNGNIAKGVKVTFTINGNTYTRTSDSNGYASFKITLNPKTYTITAKYQGYKVSNKVVVKPTLVLSAKTVKKSTTFTYTVKLLNTKGSILKNKQVTVKFKGKTYTAKTNAKGIATYKIKLNAKTGKFTLTASYGSAKISKTITVK